MTNASSDFSELIRGCEAVISPEELENKLQSKPALRVKAGFDPTAPDLHFGHLVLLNKLRTFQEQGHRVVFLIGDFTGMIGDPSGKNVMRKPLSREELEQNAQTYCDQIGKVLDLERIEIQYNSSWMSEMSAADLIRLAAQSTVARMLERDDFGKRYRDNKPIAIHEFLYPLVQGYDSVHLNADVELGGTDQTFNLLMGRELQRHFQQKPQVVMTLPLLEGLDGVHKMSKSLQNSIELKDTPADMFGKIMSLSDTLMWRYFELLSTQTQDQIKQMKTEAEQGKNPRDFKMSLAQELVARFHGSQAAETTVEDFIRRFRNNQLPADMEEVVLNTQADQLPLVQVLKEIALTPSSSQAIRLIEQGGIKVDSKKVLDRNTQLLANQEYVLQVGKRHFKKAFLKKNK